MEKLTYTEALLLNTALVNMIGDIKKYPDKFVYTDETGNNVFYTESEVETLRKELLSNFDI